MNLNKLAQIITKKEGLKKSLSIAQVKEVLKLTLRELKALKLEDLINILKRQK